MRYMNLALLESALVLARTKGATDETPILVNGVDPIHPEDVKAQTDLPQFVVLGHHEDGSKSIHIVGEVFALESHEELLAQI